MATATTITLRADEGALQTIETVVNECALLTTDTAENFVRTLKLASGVKMLNRLVSDSILDDIMELQGLTLGFLTDQDKSGGYDRKIVKRCVIEAMINGATVLNNEFNIISQRVYYAKNFFVRKLREFPGLTDLRLTPGVPKTLDGGALVPYVATWNLNGVADEIRRLVTKMPDGLELDQRIPVKVNAGMGADAILGKAERKMRAAIYSRLTGSMSSVVDGEIGDDGVMLQGPSNANAIQQRLEPATNGTNGHAEAHAADPAAGAPRRGTGPISAFIDELRDCKDAGECRALFGLRYGEGCDREVPPEELQAAEKARNKRIAELGK